MLFFFAPFAYFAGNILVDHDEDIACSDSVAFGNADLANGAVAGGLHFVLHLHRLDDDDALALSDGVAGRFENADDLAGHCGLDLGVAAIVART